jgi:hypothetical protein
MPVRRADLDHELQRSLNATPADIHPEIRRLWSLAPKPDRFPFYGGFVPDVDGNLWVMTYRARRDVASMWHVLNSTGAELGRIRMPARFQPMFINREHVIGVAKDENDVEFVQVWAYGRSQ